MSRVIGVVIDGFVCQGDLSLSKRFLKRCALPTMTIATPGLATAQIVAYGTKSPIAITSFNVNKLLAGTNNEEPPEYVVCHVRADIRQ